MPSVEEFESKPPNIVARTACERDRKNLRGTGFNLRWSQYVGPLREKVIGMRPFGSISHASKIAEEIARLLRDTVLTAGPGTRCPKEIMKITIGLTCRLCPEEGAYRSSSEKWP